jgi:hypothetical protein
LASQNEIWFSWINKEDLISFFPVNQILKWQVTVGSNVHVQS